MLEVKNFERCREARGILRDLYDQRIAKRNEIVGMEEKIQLLQGQLLEAENVLSQIEEASAAAASGATAVALDILARDGISAARDTVGVAITIANLKVEQRQRIRNLQGNIRRERVYLTSIEEALGVIQRDIDQNLAFLRAHDCAPPFLP